MKRISSMLILCVLSVLLISGCIQSELSIEIKPDRSGSYEILLEVDKEAFTYIAAISGDNIDDYPEKWVKEIETEGYTVKADDKGDSYAIVYGKDFVDIKELNIEGFVDENQSVLVDFSESKSGSYLLQITMDNLFNSEEFNMLEESDEFFDLLEKDIEVTTRITLPSKPISHNADEVKGKTLTWDIIELSKESGDVVLKMEYKDSEGFVGMSLIILLIVIIAVGLFFYLRNNQAKKGEEKSSYDKN